MDSILIRGGKPLLGQVEIQGSKNAVLPLIAAAALIQDTVVLHNCPMIKDIDEMLILFECIGGTAVWKGHDLHLDGTLVNHKMESAQVSVMPEQHTKSLRASVLFLGALLGRTGCARLYHPGGCGIGKRPIELHISTLIHMGYEYIDLDTEFVMKRVREDTEISITLPYKSVGVTENVLLAASLSGATVTLCNASVEPEIVTLCEFLNLAGARIEGVGSECLKIRGVHELHSVKFIVPPDRIVAGTYALAAMATHGMVELLHPPMREMRTLMTVMEHMGAILIESKDSLLVIAPKHIRPITYIETSVYPGFATDLQSQLMVALTQAEGNSCIRETIFESRFKIVPQLEKMGANISVSEDVANIYGNTKIRGCEVLSEDLRGGAALVLAGLAADGVTVVRNIALIERGYENIVRDMRVLGADINLQ